MGSNPIKIAIGTWPNLVRLLVWVQETAGSTPVVPTIRIAEIHERKDVLIIIQINRNEREALIAAGVKCGEGGISVTTSRHSGKTWYLCESWENKKLLRQIRKNQRV